MHPSWSHVYFQTSLKPISCPISISLQRYQAYHPIYIWMTTPPYHVSFWSWWHYHPWPLSRGFPRRLPLSKYIQWPNCFSDGLEGRAPNYKHSIVYVVLFIFGVAVFCQKKPTSLCRPFERIRSLHILLIHQNVPMDLTYPTNPWIPSLYFFKSHLWEQPTKNWYYKRKYLTKRFCPCSLYPWKIFFTNYWSCQVKNHHSASRYGH